VAFAERRIYVLALLAFVALYGLEHIVLASRERDRAAAETGVGGAVYWIHLAGFAAYSGLIGYLLVERAERGPVALVVYAVAMALHFLIVDHALSEEHGRFYDASGRAILVAAVVLGWLVGARTPLSDVKLARVFAVLAGGVVITAATTELPGERRGRFWPFCLGAASYATLLFLT
jgi:drug/metabolite transporter superfamily protein YnfA